MELEKGLSPDVTLVCKLGKDGTIRYINKSYTDVTGYTEAEIIGKSHEKLQDPRLPAVISKRIWETIKSHKHAYFASKNYTKNNEFFWTVADIHSRMHENKPTAIFIRRKFLPLEIRGELEQLFQIIYEIENHGGGEKVAQKYLEGWFEDRNVSCLSEYIVNKFGGEKKLAEYMNAEIPLKELFKVDAREMGIDEILKTVKKNKKRRFGLW